MAGSSARVAAGTKSSSEGGAGLADADMAALVAGTSGYYRYPAVHGDTVVFVTEDDLWSVPRSGGMARRLTSTVGSVAWPAISPDGSMIAYTGSEEGVSEVYLMPTTGGKTQRLTYMSSDVRVLGWLDHAPTDANDKRAHIIFASNALHPYFPREAALFSIAADSPNGEATALPYGPARSVAFGAQGGVVLGRFTGEPATWKRYRGGTAGQLWVDATGLGTFTRLLPELGGNIAAPLWLTVNGQERIYFVSDHEGVGNLYSVTPAGEDLRRHTDSAEFYVRNPTTDGTHIVYHAAADLFVFDPATDTVGGIAVTFHGPRHQRSRRFVDATRFLDNVSISPGGRALALSTRGKLFSFYNHDGPVLQLGKRTGVRYRLPTWNDDGSRLLVISDEPGEERLEIHEDEELGPPRVIEGLDMGRPVLMRASPTEDKVAIVNHRNELLLVDFAPDEPNGKGTRAPVERMIVVDRSLHGPIAGVDWSPDGRWLAYGSCLTPQTTSIRLYRLEDKSADDGEATEAARATPAPNPITITQPLLRDIAPAFDPEGKYLYFLSMREFNPVYDGLHFDLGFPWGMRPYLITLRADLPNPFDPHPELGEEESGTRRPRRPDPDDDEDEDEDETRHGTDAQPDADDDDNDGDDDDEGSDADDEFDDEEQEDDGDETLSEPNEGEAQVEPLAADVPADDAPNEAGDDTAAATDVEDADTGKPAETSNANVRANAALAVEGQAYATVRTAGVDAVGADAADADAADADAIKDPKKPKGKGDAKAATSSSKEAGKEAGKEAKESEDSASPDQALRIDLDGISERLLAFPVADGRYGKIVGIPGKAIFSLFDIEGTLDNRDAEDSDAPQYGAVRAWSFKEYRSETLVENASWFEVSANNKKLLYASGKRLRVIGAGEKAPPDHGPSRRSGWIDLQRVKVSVDLLGEWRQMLREAWRLQRDNFWTEDMSQVDWQAAYLRYEPLLERVSTRQEFSDLLKEMQGELGTSHAYEMGGDYRPSPQYRQGFLGAILRWEPAARGYRVERIVQGDPWLKGAHSPLAEAGVDVRVGDVLLAVNGQPVDEATSPASLLVSQAGNEVLLTFAARAQEASAAHTPSADLSPADVAAQGNKAIQIPAPSGKPVKAEKKTEKNPEKKPAAPRNRNIIVRTLRNEYSARYREWVDAKRRLVHERTGGRIGYVHIPDMGATGYAEFHRGFLAETDREGLVVDVRYNGGGHVSQLILEKLARRRLGYDVSRWGGIQPYPVESVGGPQVALTNELAGSDGDIFCHGFKMLKLGPLVGKRTWGGVVGINPRHPLVDGTITTQPEFAFWFEDVGWNVENYGTEPDIDIDYAPQDYVAETDPQLERAIAEALRLLEAQTSVRPNLQERPSRAAPRLPARGGTR